MKYVAWAIKRANQARNATCGLDGNPEKGEKIIDYKSQNRKILPPRGVATCEPILTQLGVLVDLTNIITPASYGSKNSSSFVFVQTDSWKTFPLDNLSI